LELVNEQTAVPASYQFDHVAVGVTAQYARGQQDRRGWVDHRPAIVGSAGYFKSHPRPKTPRDLLQHRCINFRHGRDEIYRWEFDKGKQSLTVAVNGPLIVDDVDLVIRAALDGVGRTSERIAPRRILIPVRSFASWSSGVSRSGFFLYYPSRRQQPAALSTLIDALRLENPRK
jgi:DNA-binding transcriptional LysR family regulator